MENNKLSVISNYNTPKNRTRFVLFGMCLGIMTVLVKGCEAVFSNDVDTKVEIHSHSVPPSGRVLAISVAK
jgi:hypothetical protein